jgi:hypothetical protein
MDKDSFAAVERALLLTTIGFEAQAWTETQLQV